jgi:hypothetical protein
MMPDYPRWSSGPKESQRDEPVFEAIDLGFDEIESLLNERMAHP